MDGKRSPTCLEVEEAVIGILNGRGNRDDLEPWREHLRGCSGCREFGALADRIAPLAGPVPEPGSAYWEEFLPRLEARIERAGFGRTPRPPGGRRWMPLAASLAVGFAGLLGWLLIPHGGGGTLEARLDEILIEARGETEPAEILLEEILPGGFDARYLDGEGSEAEEEIYPAGLLEEQLRDLLGPVILPEFDYVSELDIAERREFFRELRRELKEPDPADAAGGRESRLMKEKEELA